MQYSAFKSFNKKNRKASKLNAKLVSESPLPVEGGLQPSKQHPTHHIAI